MTRIDGPLQSPYRGILPFRYKDREFFFGRDRELNELKAKILLYRLVLLFGESGCGKSSLLNAGIVPSLQREGFQTERLRVRPFEDEPILMERINVDDESGAFLPSALSDVLENAGAGSQIPCSLDRFRQIVHRRNALVVPVLIFDQFEELFTLFEAGPRSAQAAILSVLYELFNSKEPAAKVVIAIREDFLAKLEVLSNKYPQVFDRRVRLGPLGSDAARQAIRGAFHVGHTFPSEISEDASEAIIKGFITGIGEPVIHSTQLQIVCSRLWNECAGRAREITAKDFEYLGGVQGILEGFLESEMGQLPADRQSIAYQLLGHLITSSGTRDVVSEERLHSLLHGEEQTDETAMKSMLRFLETRRLINRSAQRSTFYYEVSSEYLIGPIQTYNEAKAREDAASRAAAKAVDREREASRERQLEQARLLADAERQRAELQTKAAKRLRYGLVILAAALGATLLAAYSARFQEQKAKKIASELDAANRLNGQRVSTYHSNLRLKQDALSGDPEAVVKSLKAAPSGVQFLVNAPPRGYSGPSGPVYAFEFYPKTETVPGGLQALAMVTYKMNHPTFKNTILAAGPDRDFKASYDGWGCLTRVIAIIEYRDPDKKAEVTEFNMCQLLHWQTFKALDSRILP